MRTLSLKEDCAQGPPARRRTPRPQGPHSGRDSTVSSQPLIFLYWFGLQPARWASGYKTLPSCVRAGADDRVPQRGRWWGELVKISRKRFLAAHGLGKRVCVCGGPIPAFLSQLCDFGHTPPSRVSLLFVKWRPWQRCPVWGPFGRFPLSPCQNTKKEACAWQGALRGSSGCGQVPSWASCHLYTGRRPPSRPQ